MTAKPTTNGAQIAWMLQYEIARQKRQERKACERLPKSQHDLIRLWVLGGIDAIGRHSTRTVSALIKAGYADKSGPTGKARNYVDYHERKEIRS